MIRTLENISGNPLVLTDFNGMTVGAGEIFDGLVFGESALKNSTDIVAALLNGSLSLSDGTNVYEGLLAIDIIRYGQVVSTVLNGRPIVVSTDRPDGTYRYFSGSIDDTVGGVRGEGPELTFDVPPGESHSIDCRYVDNYWLKDGLMMFKDAVLGSYLRAEVICPANTPFPWSPKTGNWDRLADGTFVPNATNTGAWLSVPMELVLHRFVNKLLVLGCGKVDIFVPEPQEILPMYFVRLTVRNPVANTVNMLACVTKGMYRKNTV